jgi:uncharacterized protein
MTAPLDSADINTRPRGPWYRQPWPWLLMAGPAVVVVASFYSGWLALTTDDGVVADDYYKRGLSINRKLERVDRAVALQLAAIVDVAPDGGIEVSLNSPSPDPDTMPALLRVVLAHPTRAGLDRQAELLRGPDGRYMGHIAPVVPGRWLVVVETDAWRLPVVEVSGALRDVRLGGAVAPAHS